MVDLSLKPLLESYNSYLKQNRPQVSIEIRGKYSIGLRSKLVGKAGEPVEHRRIPLSDLEPTPAGLALAYQRALELQTQLRTSTFKWELWPGRIEKAAEKIKRSFLCDLLPDLEDLYFRDRPRTLTKRNTWRDTYVNYYDKFPKHIRPTLPTVVSTITNEWPVDSRARQQAKQAFTFLARFLKWDANDIDRIESIESSYRRGRRDLESLEDLVALGDSLTGSIAITFRLLLTYGIRPHELFLIDPASIDREYLGIIKIREGGKSKDSRLVMPLSPQLYERWRLWEYKDTLPKTKGATLKIQGQAVAKQFARAGLTLRPYDLRHAYSTNNRAKGMRSEIVARAMGHRTTTHEKVYLADMRADTERESLVRVLQANPDAIDLDKEVTLPDRLKPKTSRLKTTPRKKKKE